MTAMFGITGWSGSGKTTLIEKLVPLLSARGFVVGVLKHAHHQFEIDREGKDSHRFRQAGCREVAVSSSRRWAMMHELSDDETEPDAFAMLGRFSPSCTLVLVEGYKDAAIPKLEVWRQELQQTPLAQHNPHVIAVAADDTPPSLPPHCAVLPLSAPDEVAEFVAERAVVVEGV